MKRIFRIMMTALAATTLASSCAKDGSGNGTVSFRVSEDGNVSLATKSSVSDYTEMPSPEDFDISIVTSSEDVIPVEDPNGQTTLPVGIYTAKASYGSAEDEGFDKPFFSGEQAFTVASGQASLVWIEAKLSNSIIRMEYTENFRKYYTDFSFTVTTGNGKVIEFPSTETRAAFVDAYQIKVNGTLVNQGGKTLAFPEKEYKGLQPATCYTIRFDASNIGSGSVIISFNNTPVDVNLGDHELND